MLLRGLQWCKQIITATTQATHGIETHRNLLLLPHQRTYINIIIR